MVTLVIGFSMLAQPIQKTTLAVMDLTCTGISSGEATLLTEKLLTALFNTSDLNVIELSKRNEILREQGFQQTGACDETSCLVEAGKFLSVEKMVGGSAGKIENIWALNIRLIDVETGKVEKAVAKTSRGGIDSVFYHLDAIAREIAVASLHGSERAYRDSIADETRRKAREIHVRDSLTVEARKNRLKYPLLTYGSLGTSVVLAATATLFYFKAKSTYDEYTLASTPEEALRDWDRTTKYSRAVTWCSALSAGLAGTAVATWFLRTKVHPELSVPNSETAEPALGLGPDGQGMIAVCWRF